MTPSRDISRLIEIMAALRTPGTGCPWDLEQDFATIAPYTIEEAYEVADAIARADLGDLKDELGDLLLQVVFHARMAEEQGAFSFGDVVEAITAKMIRRHPHVFADSQGRLTASDVKGAWERIKAEEKGERAARRQGQDASHKSSAPWRRRAARWRMRRCKRWMRCGMRRRRRSQARLHTLHRHPEEPRACAASRRMAANTGLWGHPSRLA